MKKIKKLSEVLDSQQNKSSNKQIKRLKELFESNSDVTFKPVHFVKEQQSYEVQLIYCEGMIDEQALDQRIMETLNRFFAKPSVLQLSKEYILNHLSIPSLQSIEKTEDLLSNVFNGAVVLLFQGCETLFAVNLGKKPQRQPEETNMEVAIVGPRDNFIEDITVNMALIRKRLPSNSLCSEDFIIGRRSQTKVRVLYIKDITDQQILQELRTSIHLIDIDVLFSGNQLMSLIEKKSSFFPRYDYSGRPDFAVQSLVTGRVIILIDGFPYVIITPANLFLLFKSAEDSAFPVVFNSMERLGRIMGLFIAIFVPGFWIAITAFHQNQLPISLLATVVESRRGVPLSPALEGFLMLIIFELFREAGLRLPMAIGQTLSVVGGLIIGDSAIRAGITSPSMLVVIAGSIVAGFTIVNQTLIGTVSVLRFFVLLLSSFLGFFGFFVSMFFIITYLSNIRIFGVPYLSFVTRFDIKSVLVTSFRLPWKAYAKRPSMLNPKDSTRKEGE